MAHKKGTSNSIFQKKIHENWALLITFLPSTIKTIDLMEYSDNKTIWQESYYLHTKFFYGVSRCVTINSPIKTLKIPNDFDVSTLR